MNYSVINSRAFVPDISAVWNSSGNGDFSTFFFVSSDKHYIGNSYINLINMVQNQCNMEEII